METESRTVPLADITQDPRLQPRVALDREIVEEYAARYAEGTTMPAVTLFHKGDDFWLADGFHRAAAAEQAGLDAIPADVRSGTFHDALLFAASANAGHGLRRSNADKRRAVEMLLADPECAGWADSEIARHCQVDHKTVAAVRAGILGNSQDKSSLILGNSRDESSPILGNSQDAPAVRTVTRNGKTYAMRVGNIGRRSVNTEPNAAKTLFPASAPRLNGQGLLPCPFCGNLGAGMAFDQGVHAAACPDPACNVVGPRGKSPEEAREGWNRRA